MRIAIALCLLGVTSAELPRVQSARFRFQHQELAPSSTEAATTQASEAGAYPTNSIPYPPSGWKPTGQAFTLPNKAMANEESTPSDSYGAPTEKNGRPYPPSGWTPGGEAFILPNEQPAAKKEVSPSDNYGAPVKQSGPYILSSGWTSAGENFSLQARRESQSPPASSYGIPNNTYGPPDTEYGPPSTESDSTTTEITTDIPQVGKLSVNIQKSEGVYYILLPNGQLQKVDVTTEEDPRNMVFSAKLRYPARNQAPLFVFKP